MIHCIIFDLSEVIIAGLIGVEQTFADRFGVDPSTVLSHLGGGDRLARLCCGSWSEAEYLSAVRAASGWDLADAELRSAIRENFGRCVDGMPDLVRRLARTHELVLLSDHGREWIAHIEAVHAFLGVFSRRIYSFDTGMMKTSVATFHHLLGLLGREAGECLFIDDNPGNIARAGGAGIAAIRFTGYASLDRDLRARGIVG